MAKDEKKIELAEVVWVNDSKEVLKSFPVAVRKELGEDLFRVQAGVRPKDFKPMKSIGKKVFELRQRDSNGWYRVIYLGIIDGVVHVLHSFVKKSGKTPQNDLDVASKRLKGVHAKLREAKRRK